MFKVLFGFDVIVFLCTFGVLKEVIFVSEEVRIQTRKYGERVSVVILLQTVALSIMYPIKDVLDLLDYDISHSRIPKDWKSVKVSEYAVIER